MRLETLQSLVARLPAYGDRPAVGLRRAYGARWWSYRRLHREARGFAGWLRAQGVAPGARMLLWAGNCPEWAGAFLGAVLRGVVVVPVDEAASPHWVRRLADDVRPALLLHGPDQEVSGLDLPGCSIFEVFQFQTPEPEELSAASVKPDDVAVILYSSGTTRKPTGVLLTHRNLISQLEAFDRWRRLTRWLPCRLLALSPLSHVQGVLMGLCLPLALGVSTLYSDSVDPAHVIRTIRQNRIAMLLTAPRVQRLLARALEATPSGRGKLTLGERVRTIRFFPLRRHILFLATHAQLGYSFWVLLVGGATLSPEDERFWYECGYILVQGYGLTETAALVSSKINGPFFPRLGSVGRPLPHQEVRLGPDGEVLVRGPNVSHRIFGHDDADGQAPSDGFLRTGDLARWDAGGRLYFLGRKKDVIVTSEGLNVYPGDVEAILERAPGVRDAVVLGLSRNGMTEVHAALLLTDGTRAEGVIALANQTLEAHQRVRGWTVWPGSDFPRAGLLKIRREEIVRTVQALQDAPRADEAQEMESPSLEEIRATSDRRRRLQLLARYVSHPGKMAARDATGLIDELGLSSLDAVELLTLLERDLSRPLDRLAITPRTTLAHLHALARTEPSAPRPGRLPMRQPGWSRGFLGDLVRRISQPLLIGLWAAASARITAEWLPGVPGIEGACIFAAAPHRHWLDSFIVYAALPRRWRKRLMTIANEDFSEYFTPAPEVPPRRRLWVGAAYYLIWPLAFSFVVMPNFGATREGLYELGRLIDQGYSPITFPSAWARDGGWVAMMALQFALPIVPVWIEGNEDLRVSPRPEPPRITARLGPPIRVHPAMTPSQVIAQVEAALDGLAARSREAR